MIFEPTINRVIKYVDVEGDPYPREVVVSEEIYFPLKEIAEYNTYMSTKKRDEKQRPRTYRDFTSGVDERGW